MRFVAIGAQGAQTGVKPPATAPDLKTVLFDAASSLGMLRGDQYQDRIITQEYWATGSLIPRRSDLQNYGLPPELGLSCAGHARGLHAPGARRETAAGDSGRGWRVCVERDRTRQGGNAGPDCCQGAARPALDDADGGRQGRDCSSGQCEGLHGRSPHDPHVPSTSARDGCDGQGHFRPDQQALHRRGTRSRRP